MKDDYMTHDPEQKTLNVLSDKCLNSVLDDLSDLFAIWARNRKENRTPVMIRSAILAITKQISPLDNA